MPELPVPDVSGLIRAPSPSALNHDSSSPGRYNASSAHFAGLPSPAEGNDRLISHRC